MKIYKPFLILLTSMANSSFSFPSLPQKKLKIKLPILSHLEAKLKLKRSESQRISGNVLKEEMSFDVDNIPLCRTTASFIKLETLEETYLIGTLPEEIELINKEFPTQVMIDSWKKNNPIAKIISPFKKCYFNSTKNRPKKLTLLPAIIFQARAEKNLLEIILGQEKTLDSQNLSFDLARRALVHPRDVLDNQLSEISIGDQLENHRLATSFLNLKKTILPISTSGHEVLAFDENNLLFSDLSCFAHAIQHDEWFRNIDGNPSFYPKLELETHAEFDGDVNNAFYQAGGADQVATIFIGDGDGYIFKNLATDADVVSHELGHHYIFQYFRGMSHQARLIHEALADYFVMSKNNDSCFARTICGSEASFCSNFQECLRNSENDQQFDPSENRSQTHEQSQFLSGFLWSLREDPLFATSFDSKVFAAVKMLHDSSGLRDFVIALILSDRVNGDDRLEACETILDKAISRNLGSITNDIDCQNLNQLRLSPPNNESSKQSPKKNDLARAAGCGSIASSRPSDDQHRWIMILLLFPSLLFVGGVVLNDRP